MKQSLISVVKYVVSLAIAGGLFWYVYKDLDLSASLEKLREANYSWIILSLFLSVIGHLARAYRWNLLLEPLGYKLTTLRTFMAVMVGYLANLLVPRMGEITRCGVLKRTDDVPMTTSIGTVVAERVLDFLVLLFLVGFTFMIEFDRLNEFILGLFSEKAAQAGQNLFQLYLLGGGTAFLILVLFLLARTYKEHIRRNALFLKIKTFLRQMVGGLTSIRKINHKGAFWFCTFLIWFIYYLMSYVVFFALDSTAELGVLAGLTILIMGGLGMAAPVQGGIGTFHAMVSGALILYGIPEDDGVLFAFILHMSQTVAIVFVGSVSFLITLFIRQNKSTVTVKEDVDES